MPKKSTAVDAYIKVYLNNPNNFSNITFGGMFDRTPQEIERDIAHLEYSASRQLNANDHCRGHIESVVEYESVCEYCGWGWTEDIDDYNGGCCDEDEKNNPNPEPII